jgi:DNA-binding transcriptional ArsR family regulator
MTNGRTRAMVVTMPPIASALTMAEIAARVGDPARSNMLAALMAGRALTASELAAHAGVTAQTASGHLATLTESGLLSVARQGRHRYYRLASPLVARMLEGIMAVAAVQGAPRHRPSSRIDDALRTARTCYDHLAGRLGVALAESLTQAGHIALSDDGGTVTRRGRAFFAEFGIDLAQAMNSRRCFCRPCLDWSERRTHLGGALGAVLADRCFGLGWIERRRDTRAVAIPRRGEKGFREVFAIDLATLTD